MDDRPFFEAIRQGMIVVPIDMLLTEPSTSSPPPAPPRSPTNPEPVSEPQPTTTPRSRSRLAALSSARLTTFHTGLRLQIARFLRPRPPLHPSQRARLNASFDAAIGALLVECEQGMEDATYEGMAGRIMRDAIFRLSRPGDDAVSDARRDVVAHLGEVFVESGRARRRELVSEYLALAERAAGLAGAVAGHARGWEGERERAPRDGVGGLGERGGWFRERDLRMEEEEVRCEELDRHAACRKMGELARGRKVRGELRRRVRKAWLEMLEDLEGERDGLVEDHGGLVEGKRDSLVGELEAMSLDEGSTW